MELSLAETIYGKDSVSVPTELSLAQSGVKG